VDISGYPRTSRIAICETDLAALGLEQTRQPFLRDGSMAMLVLLETLSPDE